MDNRSDTEKQLLVEAESLRRRVADLESGQDAARDAVRSSEERLRTLFAAVPDLIVRLRRDGTFLDYSPSTEFTTYVPPDRFLGAKMREMMPADVVDALMEGIERTIVRRTREIVEYELPERNGTLRYFEARMIMSGVDEVVAIVRDVTQRKRAEKALRESERRYRELFENSRGLICTHDLEGNFLEANPAAAASLGYKPEEIVGHNLRELIVPSARHLLEPYLERMGKEGKDSGIIHIVARDGGNRYWTYRNVLRRDEAREPYVIGHALDVTDLHRAEKAARGHGARSRALFEHAPFAICSVSEDQHVIAASRRLLRALGYDAEEELIGREVDTLFADKHARDRLLKPWKEGAAVQGVQVNWRCKDGKTLSARSSAWPVLLDDGRLDSIQIVAEVTAGTQNQVPARSD